MFGATYLGNELGPRIAARLKLSCITGVERIGVEGENLVIAKSCYEEKVYQNFNFRPKRTLVLTVLPGSMDSEKIGESGEMVIVNEEVGHAPTMRRTRSIKFIKGDPRKIRLEEADLIVALGKGIGKGLASLEDLADTLGASIGGTRPLVDDGMVPFERQIGITGRSVVPKLLLAIGISGAREFMAGVEKSRLTIAINTDARAPIFRQVDVGVHGDVNDIVPALIEKIRLRKEQGH
jgi:electron transfer flavoprotein alpha subunit